MLNPEQIPTGVVAVFDAVWEMTRCTDKAIAAAINAWPGAVNVYKSADEVSADLILPLPQEAPQGRINQENTNAES